MRQTNTFLNLALVILACSIPALAFGQTYISIEMAQTYQSRNDQRIPGKTGDLFTLTDFSKGPFFTNRVYVGHRWSDRHEIRALYAPLEVELNSEFASPVRFINSTFAANTPTVAYSGLVLSF